MGYGLPPERNRSTIDRGSRPGMDERDPHTITLLLNRLGADDDAATEELWPLVYRELHRLAEVHMAHERPGQTLQPTALVHEFWIYISSDAANRARGARGLCLLGRTSCANLGGRRPLVVYGAEAS